MGSTFYTDLFCFVFFAWIVFGDPLTFPLWPPRHFGFLENSQKLKFGVEIIVLLKMNCSNLVI